MAVIGVGILLIANFDSFFIAKNKSGLQKVIHISLSIMTLIFGLAVFSYGEFLLLQEMQGCFFKITLPVVFILCIPLCRWIIRDSKK